jgi:monoamine oxidase
MSVLHGLKVIVAGGGLAGLCAAFELSRRGASVHLLEARDRLGGRVWTYRDPGRGHHVELGGELIDAEHEAIRRLASALRLTLVRVLPHGFGLALSIEGRIRVARTQAGAWRALARLFGPAARALEASGGDWHSPAAHSIAMRSFAAVLRASRADPRVVAMATAMRGYYLADPEELSSLVVAEQVAHAAPGRSAMYRIEGGTDRLVDRLARRIRGRISLRTVLRAVTTTSRGVRVAVDAADARRAALRADYAVITLPAPLVRGCVFEPPLDAVQRRAFGALRYGAATKAFLEFSKPWWRRPGRPRAFGSNLPIGAVWDAADDQMGAAILTLLAGGRASASLQALLASGCDHVVRRLAWLGEPGAGWLAAPSVTWENEPWSKGGYAVFTPGFDPRWRVELSRAHGRILFAGEHTSENWQGFMNGAVESGQLAATSIEQLERIRAWPRT